MAADDALSEAQMRLEHKLDLVLELLTQLVAPGPQFTLTPLGDQKHICPVCTQPVSYQVDVIKKVVARKCGCSTGKLAPMDLSAFAPALTPKKEIGYGDTGSVPEDGSNSSARGRSIGR